MPYGRVGLLRVALPEGVLVEGHRRELGVRADRADHDRLRGVAQPGLVEHVGAHQEVVEVEVGGAGHVGADAADPGRQVDHQVGLDVGEHRGDGRAVAQVVVGARGRHHRAGLPGREPVEHGLAEEAVAPRHQHPSGAPELEVGLATHRRHPTEGWGAARSAPAVVGDSCTHGSTSAGGRHPRAVLARRARWHGACRPRIGPGPASPTPTSTWWASAPATAPRRPPRGPRRSPSRPCRCPGWPSTSRGTGCGARRSSGPPARST